MHGQQRLPISCLGNERCRSASLHRLRNTIANTQCDKQTAAIKSLGIDSLKRIAADFGKGRCETITTLDFSGKIDFIGPGCQDDEYGLLEHFPNVSSISLCGRNTQINFRKILEAFPKPRSRPPRRPSLLCGRWSAR